MSNPAKKVRSASIISLSEGITNPPSLTIRATGALAKGVMAVDVIFCGRTGLNMAAVALALSCPLPLPPMARICNVVQVNPALSSRFSRVVVSSAVCPCS